MLVPNPGQSRFFRRLMPPTSRALRRWTLGHYNMVTLTWNLSICSCHPNCSTATYVTHNHPFLIQEIRKLRILYKQSRLEGEECVFDNIHSRFADPVPTATMMALSKCSLPDISKLWNFLQWLSHSWYSNRCVGNAQWTVTRIWILAFHLMFEMQERAHNGSAVFIMRQFWPRRYREICRFALHGEGII